MSKVMVKLSGVKTTLNNLAVRLELSWHVLRDFDSINRMAEVGARRERKERRRKRGEKKPDDFMMPVFIVLQMPSRRRCVEYCKPEGPDGVAESMLDLSPPETNRRNQANHLFTMYMYLGVG